MLLESPLEVLQGSLVCFPGQRGASGPGLNLGLEQGDRVVEAVPLQGVLLQAVEVIQSLSVASLEDILPEPAPGGVAVGPLAGARFENLPRGGEIPGP